MTNFKKALDVLKNGGIVIFPTDTAFGIGCRIDNNISVKRLIEIRGRDENKPLPVLVADLEMAQDYLKSIPKQVIERLINKYWPGGLTIVLPCKEEKINPIIRANGKSLGVRMPDNKITLRLIKELGFPIIGCSANFPSEKTPYFSKEINPKLIKLADFVLEGECLKKSGQLL